MNLEVEGTDILVALAGPQGVRYPHTVVLGNDEDFLTWPHPVGERRLPARVPAFASATRTTGEPWTSGGREGGAGGFFLRSVFLDLGYNACALRLSELQEASAAIFGWARCSEPDAGINRHGRKSSSGRSALATAAAAASADSRSARGSVRLAAVVALVGSRRRAHPLRGRFPVRLHGRFALHGGESAESTRRGPLFPALCEAVEESHPVDGNDQRLAPALRDARLLARFRSRTWPGRFPRSDEAEALAALGELCGLGHSSGADIATGFLYGLRPDCAGANDESAGGSVR